MDREGIRRLAAEELGLDDLALSPSPSPRSSTWRPSPKVGLPCVVKPIMSSERQGPEHGPKTEADDRDRVGPTAQEGARGGAGRVIVEGFVDFDYEITLLTVRHAGGTSYCEPVGHRQVGGDYHESWQPQPMSDDRPRHRRGHGPRR